MESREVGSTEHSWCRAVPGGTGITVLALLVSKPIDLEILQNALHKLQNSHPILRTKLQFNPSTRKFSFVTPSFSTLSVKSLDIQSTLRVLDDCTGPACGESLFHKLIEHELNLNPWEKNSISKSDGCDLFEATVYKMEGPKWTVVMKAHTAVCDRTSGEAVLRDLVRICRRGAEFEIGGKGEVKMGIEEYMPESRKGKRSILARGVNMLGYSLNALRLSHIDFVDTRSTRRTKLLRLQLEPDVTARLLEECNKREIKLCGALAAAALMAGRRSKSPPEGHSEKYSVATLVDCRPLLHPPLTNNDVVGFYYSAIVNTHDVNGKEQLWQLAKKAYESFNAAKSENKHFSDMADLTFLMCRAIENPGLTTSSALRTSFISVFEDVALHNTDDDYEGVGVEDYMVCSSVHGVGPTLALFGSIRDGGLDCGCAYPGPLHSREQMMGLIDHMKRILVEAS